ERPEREHDVVAVDRPFGGLDPPAAIHPVEGAGVSVQYGATELGKMRRIGARHAERIGYAGDARPVYGAPYDLSEAGLKRPRTVAVEPSVCNAEFGSLRQFGSHRI